MKKKKIFVYGGLMAKHKDRQTAFPAVLHGHKISFEVKGVKPFEPSFATLVTEENSKAYGIVIEVPENKLNKYLAHEISYSAQNVEATDMQGIVHQSIALFLKRPGYDTEVVPSARYADLLYKGGVYHGLPQEALDYYLSLKKKGHKLTYYLRFLFPLYLKCIPYVGRDIAFYSIMIFLPAIFLLLFLLLAVKLF